MFFPGDRLQGRELPERVARLQVGQAGWGGVCCDKLLLCQGRQQLAQQWMQRSQSLVLGLVAMAAEGEPCTKAGPA